MTSSSEQAAVLRRAQHLGRSLLAAFAIGHLGGCVEDATSDDEALHVDVAVNRSDAQIFGGDRDDDEASVAGVVALRVGQGGAYELCSGALVAPNVVLTARHCVTKNVSSSVSCDENGASANGKHIAGDEDPAQIGVFVGAAPSFAKEPASYARAVVTPPGDYLCDSDIALVVLAHALSGVEPLAVRLGSKARMGETIRAVGYGQNDAGAPIGTRFRRENVPVLAVGKVVSKSNTPLGPREFEVAKSICQGDSGGPAVSEATGAVIGVVSRGGGCEDDFGHIYTSTAGFEFLFEQAFAVAGATPIPEGDTSPPIRMRAATGGRSPFEGEKEPMSEGCSIGPTSPRRGRANGGGSVGVLLMAALVLGARRRG